METIIQTKNLTKIYNPGKSNEVRALEDISLAISEKQLTVFYGPSGSGKTTLLALLGTLERPTSGELLLKGNDITRLSEVGLCRLRRQTIGFIFQAFHLISRLSAWENVAYPLIPVGINAKDRRERAGWLLEQLGLKDRMTQRPEELSGGEQQRVAIARALIQDPEIIIADEPTSNIDAEAVDILLSLFSDFKKKGKAIIVASHDPVFKNQAEALFYLKRGRMLKSEVDHQES